MPRLFSLLLAALLGLPAIAQEASQLPGPPAQVLRQAEVLRDFVSLARSGAPRPKTATKAAWSELVFTVRHGSTVVEPHKTADGIWVLHLVPSSTGPKPGFHPAEAVIQNGRLVDACRSLKHFSRP